MAKFAELLAGPMDGGRVRKKDLYKEGRQTEVIYILLEQSRRYAVYDRIPEEFGPDTYVFTAYANDTPPEGDDVDIEVRTP